MNAKYNGDDVTIVDTETDGELTFYHIKKGDKVYIIQDKYVDIEDVGTEMEANDEV